MRTHVHLIKSKWPAYATAMTFLLLCIFGCNDPYQGPFIPEEEPVSFSGSIGYEKVILNNSSVTALGGLVTLSFSSMVPEEPIEVFIVTFPSDALDFQGYMTTGRAYQINMSNLSVGVKMELCYDEQQLKGTTNHIHEEDLIIFNVTSESFTSDDEKITPVESSVLDTLNNLISTTIYGSGLFLVGVQ